MRMLWQPSRDHDKNHDESVKETGKIEKTLLGEVAVGSLQLYRRVVEDR